MCSQQSYSLLINMEYKFDFRFILLPRGCTVADLRDFIIDQDWWNSIWQIEQISTLEPLAVTSITRGRLIHVILSISVGQSAQSSSDLTGLFQTSLAHMSARLTDEPSVDNCLSHIHLPQDAPTPDGGFLLTTGDTSWMIPVIETMHHDDVVENEGEGRTIYLRTGSLTILTEHNMLRVWSV